MNSSVADQNSEIMKGSFHLPESLKPAAMVPKFVGNGVENCCFRKKNDLHVEDILFLLVDKKLK